MTTIHVKATSGAKITVSVELGVLVSDLKQTLASSDKANVPASQQRLIYRGHVMKDERTLESYGTCAVHGFREPCVCVCVCGVSRHGTSCHTHDSRRGAPKSTRTPGRTKSAPACQIQVVDALFQTEISISDFSLKEYLMPTS